LAANRGPLISLLLTADIEAAAGMVRESLASSDAQQPGSGKQKTHRPWFLAVGS
jgi:hypothetical protein